jgi:hypothetical protein
MRLDLNENKCPYKEVDIGVKATALIKKSKASDRMKIEFRQESRSYLIAMTEKLRERCPLKYRLTMQTCLTPLVIVFKPQVARDRFKELVQTLHSCGKIKANIADRSVLEFSDFVEFATSRTDPFKNFSLNNDRLDEFYASMLDGGIHPAGGGVNIL